MNLHVSLEACVLAASPASPSNTLRGCLILRRPLQAAVPCMLCLISKAAGYSTAASMSAAEQARLQPRDHRTAAVPVQV